MSKKAMKKVGGLIGNNFNIFFSNPWIESLKNYLVQQNQKIQTLALPQSSKCNKTLQTQICIYLVTV